MDIVVSDGRCIDVMDSVNFIHVIKNMVFGFIIKRIVRSIRKILKINVNDKMIQVVSIIVVVAEDNVVGLGIEGIDKVVDENVHVLVVNKVEVVFDVKGILKIKNIKEV